jgi:hypothetical protein
MTQETRQGRYVDYQRLVHLVSQKGGAAAPPGMMAAQQRGPTGWIRKALLSAAMGGKIAP